MTKQQKIFWILSADMGYGLDLQVYSTRRLAEKAACEIIIEQMADGNMDDDLKEKLVELINDGHYSTAHFVWQDREWKTEGDYAQVITIEQATLDFNVSKKELRVEHGNEN